MSLNKLIAIWTYPCLGLTNHKTLIHSFYSKELIFIDEYLILSKIISVAPELIFNLISMSTEQSGAEGSHHRFPELQLIDIFHRRRLYRPRVFTGESTKIIFNYLNIYILLLTVKEVKDQWALTSLDSNYH